MPIFDVEHGGRSFEIDAPDMAAATAALTQHLGVPAQAPAPAAPAPSVPLDVAKSAGVGLGEGAIGLGGAVGDIRSALSSGTDWLGGKLGISPNIVQTFKQAAAISPLGLITGSAPTSEQLKSKVENLTGPFYQPQTVPGEYARTAGQFAPAAIGGPAGIGRRVAQVAIPALLSETAGQVYKGTEAEPYVRAGGAIAGGLAVPGAIAAGRKAITPFPISQQRQDALNVLRSEGVTDIPAGMATGNRQLNAMQSQLGGERHAANIEQAREQFTAAAMRKGVGINVPRVTQDVVNTADGLVGGEFTAVAMRNPTIALGNFRPEAQAIVQKFKARTGENAPILNHYIEQIAGTQTSPSLSVGASMGAGAPKFTPGTAGRTTITGDSYQTIQSQIQADARGTKDATLRRALYDLKGVLDKSIGRNLADPADKAAWEEARRKYANMLIIKRSLTSTTDPAASGLITPAALARAQEKVKPGSMTTGKGEFSKMANAGLQVMREFPDSGTASRLAAMAKPAAYGALAGAGTLTAGAGLLPAAAALAAPWAVGRGLTSRLGQQYLTNQRLGPGPAGFGLGGALPPVVFAPSQLRRQEEQ